MIIYAYSYQRSSDLWASLAGMDILACIAVLMFPRSVFTFPLHRCLC